MNVKDCDGHARFERMQVAGVSKQTRRFQLYAMLAAVDVGAVSLAFVLASLLRHEEVFGANGFHLAALIIPIYVLAAANTHAYGYQVLVDWLKGLSKALTSLAFAVGAVLFVAFYSRSSLEFSRVVFGTGSVAAAAFMIGGRFIFQRTVKRTVGAVLRNDLVIVDGCAAPPLGHARIIEAAAYGLRPNLRDPNMLDRLGVAVQGADFVLICCSIEDRPSWSLLLKGTDVQGFVLAPEFDSVGASELSRYEGQCVLKVASGPLDLRSRIVKRLMDLSLTIPAIVILSPLLVLVVVAIKLESRGPVLFRQERHGRANRLFLVFKFRSMCDEQADIHGNRSTSRDDERITRVGRVIRALSIDELPQLFNVLHGDMSLVGPRPHALGSLAGSERFWEVDQRYWHRHALKPGITGLAQVRGLRGATKERDDLVKRLQADLEYLNGWTLARDIAILLATVRVIIHPNAY